MIHELKTDTNYFQDVVAGYKKFEVRKQDRDFRVGDFLALNEVRELDMLAAKPKEYTGRCCLAEVVYMLEGPEYCKDGYVILGIEPCKVDVPSESKQPWERLNPPYMLHRKFASSNEHSGIWAQGKDEDFYAGELHAVGTGAGEIQPE